MMHARDYQVACHDAVLRQLGFIPWWDGSTEISRKTIANLATSAGKTIIAALLAQTLTEQGKRVLFVADREELILQPVDKFHKATGLVASVHRGQDTASAHADIVVASIQTLGRRLPPGRGFDFIIDDECHRNTEGRQKVHDAYPEAKVLGITATAFRKNLADLSDFYETLAFELGPFDLIDQGFITPIKVLTAPINVDLTGVHQKNGDYDQNEVETAIAPLYREVANAIKQYAPNRTILAFLPLIRSSKAFVEILRQEGITAEHCDGSHEDRGGVLRAFERGDFQVLSNSQVFSTGVDLIKCDCLLNLAPTRSRVEFRQRVGRILRLIPGTVDGITDPAERRRRIAASTKPDAMILDVLYQTSKIRLAGPSSLIAMNEEEEIAIEAKAKLKRTPEELQELAKEVQREKEAMLRAELERAAEAARKAGERAGKLMDARAVGLLLHQPALIDYEPVSKWERDKVSDKQKAILEAAGILPESVTSKGHAAKVLDVVFGREQKGLAALEAFPALKAAGCKDPEKLTLNQAIGMLGSKYVCTFGKKYRGRPLDEVPKNYWFWIKTEIEAGKMGDFAQTSPSAYRYLTKCVFPEMNRARQAALI